MSAEKNDRSLAEGGAARAGDVARRCFLSGLGGIALSAMLHRDAAGSGAAASRPTGRPHFSPKAKNVIWLFMVGGASHVETFDPKPALNRYAGRTIDETPYGQAILESPYLSENARDVFNREKKVLPRLYPMQVGYRPRGRSGLEVSDWWPHVGGCIDDIALVHSMWTTDIDHGAQLQFHTGRHKLDGLFPTIGSWVHYGLGSLNDDLPQFVVMGQGVADCCGGKNAHGASYLGQQHAGIEMRTDPKNPLAFAKPASDVFVEEQQSQFELLRRLNGLTRAQYRDDATLQARIRSYELAFRMQRAVPEVMRFSAETQATQRLYGLQDEATRPFGERCLAARRLVERGVRFVQIFHGGNGGAGRWDAHRNLKTSHRLVCRQVDRPIGALLTDLKQRGLLDETLVVWASEFGRTPGAQGGDGRDHHPFGFTIWMAGGGIKGGTVHGATDELGFHAVVDRHYVTDVHATVLHQLGLDPHRLDVPQRIRLDVDYGRPMRAIMA